jgi:hypothetical protein
MRIPSRDGTPAVASSSFSRHVQDDDSTFFREAFERYVAPRWRNAKSPLFALRHARLSG